MKKGKWEKRDKGKVEKLNVWKDEFKTEESEVAKERKEEKRKKWKWWKKNETKKKAIEIRENEIKRIKVKNWDEIEIVVQNRINKRDVTAIKKVNKTMVATFPTTSKSIVRTDPTCILIPIFTSLLLY